MPGYTMAPGKWYNLQGELLDQVVLAAFRAPRSYTGEDLYEISCHGGMRVRQSIMDSLLEAGAEAAGPGEFSQRAFMNGKMDLTRAEAVIDLIEAESALEQKVALSEMDGLLARAVSSISERLLGAQARLEMLIEFPEQEAGRGQLLPICAEMRALRQEMAGILDSWAQGRILSEGYRVVIAGLPNAGKSSLLNQLLGEERAIVTDEAGTTRDILEEKIILDGVPVLLTDTAGLRESSDTAEKEGVRRARAAVSKADLLIWIYDAGQADSGLNVFEECWPLLGAGSRKILLQGKSDLGGGRSILPALQEKYPDLTILPWSIYDRAALTRLRETILESYRQGGGSESSSVLLHNLRHKKWLSAAAEHLDLALEGAEQGLPPDIVAGMLRAALGDLAQITGADVSEDIAAEIFSRFCVGK